METQILNSLHSVLKQFGNKYYTGSYLNKSKVIEDIDKYDEELILAMLNAPLIKKHYFKKIDEYTIFETNKLIETFEMNDYWMDSLTKYTKRIGLTSNGKFLDESSDIVLDFPYKDTVLKAGMTKEDIEKDDLKPDEPFYNEVIASEEIDIMLDKKILINAKRYDVEGEHEITNFDDKDNLIIKGNNLLALHTLKDKYAGKVKLIYIDPPYNTGNDSFMYNDRFNHSTWLNFIYNRLSIANELLSEVGSIWLNIDDDESHYLKVLCDELFGRENFIGNIIWEKKFSPQNDATFFSDMHDHIL
ncbi:TPA: DNA methyltransferase, partial [Streptococcus agalactiae]